MRFGARNLAIVLVVLAALLASCEKGEPPRQPAEIGKKAPPFALKSLEGKTVRLSDFEGKAVVIDFWASWCHACRDAARVLESLHEKYEDKGLVVLGITMDTGFRAEENVRAFIEKYGKTYPLLWDDGRTSKTYRVINIPITYVLDKDHVVREIFTGFLPGYGEKIEAAVAPLLGGGGD